MTDPLSITVSVLALCESTITIAKSIHGLIKRYRGASGEIESIVNDFSEFGECLVVYKKVADVFQDAPSLLDAIHRASLRLQKLEDLLQKNAVGDSSQSLSNSVRWLRVRKDVIAARENVRNLFQQLNNAVTALNAASLANADRSLDHVEKEHGRRLDIILTSLAQLNGLKSQQDAILDLLSQSKQSPLAVGTSRTFIDRPDASDLSHLMPCYGLSSPSTMSMPSDLSSFSRSSQCSEFLECPKASGSPYLPMATRNAILKPQTKLYNNLGIGLSSTAALTCEATCQCRCHTYRQSDLLHGLGNLFGLLNLGHSGCSWKSSCNSMDCRRRAEPYLKLAYYLPKWLFYRRMAVLAFSTTPLGDPIFSLKVRRLVPLNSLAFQLCHKDDLEGLQHLFAKGEATPNDIVGVGNEVLFAGNYTPLLTSAVRMGSQRISEYLLRLGADVQLADADGRQVTLHLILISPGSMGT